MAQTCRAAIAGALHLVGRLCSHLSLLSLYHCSLLLLVMKLLLLLLLLLKLMLVLLMLLVLVQLFLVLVLLKLLVLLTLSARQTGGEHTAGLRNAGDAQTKTDVATTSFEMSLSLPLASSVQSPEQGLTAGPNLAGLTSCSRLIRSCAFR